MKPETEGSRGSLGGDGGGGVSSRVKKFKGFRKNLRAPQAPFIFGRRRRPCVALERRRREKNDYLQLEKYDFL